MIDPQILMKSPIEKGYIAGEMMYCLKNSKILNNELNEKQLQQAKKLLNKIGYTGYTMEEAPDDGREGHFYNEGVDQANYAWESAFYKGQNEAETLDSEAQKQILLELVKRLSANEIISSEETLKLNQLLK